MDSEPDEIIDRGKNCAFRKDDGSYCIGFRTADSVFCVGHRRAERPHSTGPRQTPGRLLQRMLGSMSRELWRLRDHEALLTALLETTTEPKERDTIFTKLASLATRHAQIFEQLAGLEDSRMRNTIAAIVAGHKAGYPTEDLRKLIAAGKAE